MDGQEGEVGDGDDILGVIGEKLHRLEGNKRKFELFYALLKNKRDKTLYLIISYDDARDVELMRLIQKLIESPYCTCHSPSSSPRVVGLHSLCAKKLDPNGR